MVEYFVFFFPPISFREIDVTMMALIYGFHDIIIIIIIVVDHLPPSFQLKEKLSLRPMSSLFACMLLKVAGKSNGGIESHARVNVQPELWWNKVVSMLLHVKIFVTPLVVRVVGANSCSAIVISSTR